MNWISQNSDLMGLIVAAVTIVVTALIVWLHLRRKRSPFTTTEKPLNHSASTSEALTQSVDPQPELTASTFSVDSSPAIQRNVFLLHVRNGATSPLATAKNVVANIGYKRKDGHPVWVDYGAWMERGTITNIEKGQTKRLIVALTDNGKNYAANWTGARSKLIDPDLVPLGELTPGRWMMVVTLNAESYERTFRFSLKIKRNGAIKCAPVQKSLW